MFYKKKRDDEYNQNRYSRSKSPQQTFIQYFKGKPNKDNNQETFNNYNYERNRDRSNSYGDQDKISEIIQEIIDITQDQIQDQDILQYPNRSYSKNPYQSRSRYDNYQNQNRNYSQNNNSRSPYRNYNSLSNYNSQNLHIELILDKDLDQDHKHQIQISIDIIIHTDHLQNQEMIIIDQDHRHLQDKILKE